MPFGASAIASTEEDALPCTDGTVEHRLDRRTNALGEAADEQLVVGGALAVLAEVERLAEVDLPFRRRGEEPERTERRERRRDRHEGKAERLRHAFEPEKKGVRLLRADHRDG